MLYDMLVFVSKVPEHISDAGYVKSTISLVGSIRQQVGDQLIQINLQYIINYTKILMEKLYQITPDKDNYTLYRIDLLKSLALNLQNQVNTWYTRITEQIKNHQLAKNGEPVTLGDWLVLGPVLEDPSQVKYEISRWPLFLHILGAVCCMGCSAIFHLFKDHSEGASQYLSRLDYAGITVMITGSSLSPLYYSYYCEDMHFWRNLYMGAQFTSSSLVFVVSLWPKFDQPQYRVFRGVLFVILGILAGFPFIHQGFWLDVKYLPNMDLQYWIKGGLLYIGGACIYMLRIPERLLPNKFDIFGSSHQIFHLCIVVAALMHYYAAVQSFHNRQITPCTDDLIRHLNTQN